MVALTKTCLVSIKKHLRLPLPIFLIIPTTRRLGSSLKQSNSKSVLRVTTSPRISVSSVASSSHTLSVQDFVSVSWVIRSTANKLKPLVFQHTISKHSQTSTKTRRQSSTGPRSTTYSLHQKQSSRTSTRH